MRTITRSFLLLLALSCGQLSQAKLSDRIIENPQSRTAALTALYTDFCLRGFSIPTGVTAYRCTQIATETVSALDLDRITLERFGVPTGYTIAFKKDLIRFVNHPASIQILRNLDFELTFNKQNFNLYQSVYSVLQNHALTLKWIAVVLQDTSEIIAHVQYLKKNLKRNILNTDVLALLESVIKKLLVEEKVNDPKNFANSQLFPKSTQKLNRHFGWRMYHFYVPAYLANKRLASGFPQANAAYASAIMNVSYEAITKDGNYIYPLGILKLSPSREKAFDVYAGYSGACYGIGKVNCIANVDEFKTIIMDDVLATMSYFRKQL